MTAEVTLTEDWCANHFDHLSPELGAQLPEVLEHMRGQCPVAHSDAYGGLWVVSRYRDVLDVAQDWETFCSSQGVGFPAPPFEPPLVPDELDPPLHIAFKRIINHHLTPARVAEFERGTRELASSLIDRFASEGRCEFMSSFAQQFPRLTFFEHVLHAPVAELGELNSLTTIAATPNHENFEEANAALLQWIADFVDRRRTEPHGDVVDALIHADINGRPIAQNELIGSIQLLMMGGFETTASALGQMMLRFARQPMIFAGLQSDPTSIPVVIEELLRLDAPVVCMTRTVTRSTELGGQQLGPGDRVVFYMASANHDEAEFAQPAEFDPARERNRHLTFGAGPHRCAGSHLARLNLQVAVEELAKRLDEIQIDESAPPITYQSAFNRTPVAVPITFNRTVAREGAGARSTISR